jgi:hypothetical protein
VGLHRTHRRLLLVGNGRVAALTCGYFTDRPYQRLEVNDIEHAKCTPKSATTLR